MIKLINIIYVLIFILLISCSKTKDLYVVNNKPFEIEKHFINPKTTDSSINYWLNPHYVVSNKALIKTPRLILYLTGTGGSPQNGSFFIDSIAKNASNVISLSYPNTLTQWSFCQTRGDECFDNFRSELLWGFDDKISKVQDISKSNCVYNRVFKLLVFLSINFHDQGWNYFISDGKIDWSNIIVSGWSQGGGLALFISKNYPVKRVVMFSAPSDYLLSKKKPASWLSKPGVTDITNIYGFASLTDKDIPIDVILSNWNAIQIPGNIEMIAPNSLLTNQHKLLIETGDHASPNYNLKYSKIWSYLFNVPH